MSDIEKATEIVVETTIKAPVQIVTGTCKGVGRALSDLADWLTGI